MNSYKPDSKSDNENTAKSLYELFESVVNYRRLGLVIAALYFVILLIVSFTFHKVADYGVETDFFWLYVPAAKSFLSGHLLIDAFRGPFYPIVLGLFYLIVGDYFYAGMLIAIFSAALVIYLTFQLIKKIFSPAVAFFVTLLLAFNPVFVQHTYSAGTDMFFIFLSTASIYFFLKEKKLNYTNLIISALFAGLAYLTRYNGIFLLGFVPVILFINYWKVSRRERIISSLLFVALFVLTFTPWGIYCLSEKGSFFYNENYKNIAYELYGKNKIPWDKFWVEKSGEYSSLFDVIKQDPLKFAASTAANVPDHFLNDMNDLMGWYTGGFVILGIIFLLIRNPLSYWRTREFAYYLMNIFFFFILLLVFYSERFSLFLIPFYAVIAVQIFFSPQFLKMNKILKRTGYILLLIICIATLSKSISFNSSRINSGPEELLELGDWFKKNIGENRQGEKIAARKPHVAYYLGLEFYYMPLVDSYDELINILRKDHVDYLFFSNIEAANRRKIEKLLNPENTHPGLKVLYSFDNPPAVLYKIE